MNYMNSFVLKYFIDNETASLGMVTETELLKARHTTPCWHLYIPESLLFQRFAFLVLEFHYERYGTILSQIEDDEADTVTRAIDRINVVASCPDRLKGHLVGIESQFRNAERIDERFHVSEHIRPRL